MTPNLPDGARARPSAVREARAIRTRMIRRRVIAGALSMFVATWLWITIVLVSGHDPALAARKTPSAAITSTTTRSATASGDSSGSATTSGTSGGATSSSGSDGIGTASSGTTSAVTTQQS